MDWRIISESIDCVKAGDLDGLKGIYADLPEYMNREYLFKQVFLSACTHEKPDIIYWLYMIFLSMNPFTQVAIRHTLTYGKYIIKDKSIKKWYEEKIIYTLNNG